ncbi:DUF433 domain-containing protein [Hoeflea sp. WL0058]|uniref:DUF433 domain-containing protein n=1 Tax=Flavimaribacter sediminis TaxID=2865987 RepID=A0AAE3D414_9HYPH|nr:DUF433 domain-containing protein [Flavimaribacter sediminis]MBW8640326.1 DUF433 domain-containing protein [Flavimaribacter sediminis]
MADSTNIISAFSEEHVERLTGVSKQQLRYWDRTDFYRPEMSDDNRRVAFSRIYSFRDIVQLRILNVLRNQYNVPLQHLRKVSQELSYLSEDKWTATELFVLNRRVIFAEPGTEKYREIVSGQYIIGLPLRTVVSDTREAVAQLSKREPSDMGQIEKKRNVSRNAAVIAGTRIPVSTIVEFHKAGYSPEQIIKEYPSLTKADVEAAIKFEGRNAA